MRFAGVAKLWVTRSQNSEQWRYVNISCEMYSGRVVGEIECNADHSVML